MKLIIINKVKETVKHLLPIYLFTCLLLGVGTPCKAEDPDAPAEYYGVPTWYEYRDKSFDITDKGSFLNPIVINTPEQLAQVAWLCNVRAESFQGKVLVLGSDINLNRTSNGQRVQWIPIGTYSRMFHGIFLGLDVPGINNEGWSQEKRHQISGMYINIQTTAIGNIADFGLFGCLDSYVGFFDIVDSQISIVKREVSVGLVCGRFYNGQSNMSYDDSRTLKIGHGIEGVSVQGSIYVKSEESSSINSGAAGIAARIYGCSMLHCTADITIRSTDVTLIGGCCSLVTSGGANSNIPSAVLDCTAKVDAETTCNTIDYMSTGGVVASTMGSAIVEACTTTGILKVNRSQAPADIYLGGICGEMWGGNIRCCANMAGLIGECTVGGIVGFMRNDYAWVDCCINSGFIDSEGYNTTNTFAGGICGEAKFTDKQEYITRCLFLGTAMNNANKLQGTLSAIVAKGREDVKSNVTFCYYDKNQFLGNTVGNDNSTTILPLTTAQLTDGNTASVSFLNIDESADYGFRLQKGRYPVLYDRKKPESFIKEIRDNKADGLNDLARQLFTAEGRNEANTVSLPGLALASMPISVNSGDCCYEFVSHLTSTVQSEMWTEETNAGRSVSLTASTTIPSTGCIRVKDNSVFAYSNGNCKLTMNGKVKTKTDVPTRPKVMDCQRQIVLNVAIDNGWTPGQEATAFAGGSGSFEDPYLVKGPFQLLLAIKNNKEGEYYRQVGDITFSQGVLNPTNLSYNIEPGSLRPDYADCTWHAHYDGDGYFVRGFGIGAPQDSKKAAVYGLFSIVAPSGTVENLGMRDSYTAIDYTSYDNLYGFLAGRVEGTVRNCIVQGANTSGKRCGGICGVVAQGGLVEDCVSAVFQYHYLLDKFTPFVAYDKTANKGTVRNCLYVTPVPYSSNKVATTDIAIIKDCYWLKGYEIANNGQTLEEIGAALSQRSTWTWTQGYFPMLKKFAETEAGKLLAIPLRSDKDYTYNNSQGQANNYLLGMTTQLQFEPGNVKWSSVNNFDGTKYLEADGDMGIIAPIAAMKPLGKMMSYTDILGPLEFIYSNMGNVYNFIPVHTAQANVKPGITIADANARRACLDSFDANKDGNLSLSELKAVTTEQTQTAFQTATARKMVSFPEFRYFKSVKRLSLQLRNLNMLKDIRLPYALETLGKEAFNGCSSLKEVTIPAKVKTIEPGAFYGSQVENIYADPFSETFTARGGLLFTKDDQLVACPNGRQGEELTISGDLRSIAEGAVYKIPGMKRLFIESSDYSTVAELAPGGIVSEDGSLPDVYINDATWDQTLFEEYLYDDSWEDFVNADKLHRYFPLTVLPDFVVNVEGQKRYLASMFIGFDTQLPDGATACIVSEANMNTRKAHMLGKGSLVPARSPVLITAMKPGVYHLTPYEEELEMWPTYENRLQGTGRDGMSIGQQYSAQGSICTLNKPDSKQEAGFHFDQNKTVPAFSTYLTFNTIGLTPEQARDTHYDIVFEASDDKNITDGDYVYDVHSVSAVSLYAAKISSYHGKGGKITIPKSMNFTTFDERQVEVPVVEMGPAAFANSKGDILSLNFLENDGMNGLTVNRSSSTNPFYGVNRSAMIYLPDNHGHTAVNGEVNVVIGTHCNNLLVIEGLDFEPPYDFTTDKASYDRTFKATENGQGGWTSMAYPICLPFFAELATGPNDPRLNKFALYKLSHVDWDKKEVVFNNDFPVISSGVPYVVVVKEGELNIAADRDQIVNYREGPIDVTAEPARYDINVLDAGGNIVDKVQWCGTFKELDNDQCTSRGIYVMQSDGTFRRVSNRSTQYQRVTTKAFRSFIETLGVLPRNAYTIKYKYQEQGDEDFPVTDFPSNNYYGEGDMPPYDDETNVEPVLRLVDADGTNRYYDLQGRRIADGQRPSAKGIYITNGRQVVIK